MADETSTSTAQEQRKKAPGRPFVKGDPRINRHGRPKSFDALRELAQQLANEKAVGADKQPIVINGHAVTQIEMILRTMMRENPERFTEIAFGKVPQPIELSGSDGGPIEVRAFEYNHAVAEIAPRPSGDSESPGEGQGDLRGPSGGQDVHGG